MGLQLWTASSSFCTNDYFLNNEKIILKKGTTNVLRRSEKGPENLHCPIITDSLRPN